LRLADPESGPAQSESWAERVGQQERFGLPLALRLIPRRAKGQDGWA
jgi:hypothetical protein